MNGNTAMTVLAAIASIFLLNMGAPFFIPLFLALMIAFALAPVVDVVERVVSVRVIAATLVVLAMLGLIGTAAYAWSDDVQRVWDQVPATARAVSGSFRKMARSPSSSVAEVKRAAAEIEAISSTGKSATPAPPPPPDPAQSSASFWELIWSGGKTAVAAVSQATAGSLPVFFMLPSGNPFKR